MNTQRQKINKQEETTKGLQLRVLTALAENQNSVPGTHVRWLTTAANPNPWNLTPLYGTYTHIQLLKCGNTHFNMP